MLDTSVDKHSGLTAQLDEIIEGLERQENAYEIVGRHFLDEGEPSVGEAIINAVRTMTCIRRMFLASWQRIFRSGARVDHFLMPLSSSGRKVVNFQSRFLQDSEELSGAAVAYMASGEEEISIAIDQLSEELKAAATAIAILERQERAEEVSCFRRIRPHYSSAVHHRGRCTHGNSGLDLSEEAVAA